MQAALAEVMKGRTTFVIAHRLATIRNASRILVFQGGRIIETGTFDELVRLGGHFAELARSQFMAGERRRGRKCDRSGESPRSDGAKSRMCRLRRHQTTAVPGLTRVVGIAQAAEGTTRRATTRHCYLIRSRMLT